jgi:hypothetical protein
MEKGGNEVRIEGTEWMIERKEEARDEDRK